MKTTFLAPIALAALVAGAVAIARQPGAVQPRQIASATPAKATTPTPRAETPDPLRVQQHEFLRKLAGVWEGQAHILSGDDQNIQGVFGCVNTITFGRYLTCSFSGKLMGENFQAVQTWGYNTAKGQYETTWIDNNSTAIAFNTGTCNDAGTVFTISGTTEDANGQSVTQKTITSVLDNDHFTLELFNVQDGKDTAVMTVSFSRSSEVVPHAPARNVTSADPIMNRHSTLSAATPQRSALPKGSLNATEPRVTPPNTKPGKPAESGMHWKSSSDSDSTSTQANAPKANEPAEVTPTQSTDATHEPDQPK